MSRSTAEIGLAGENHAVRYLTGRGYTVIGRNFRVRGGEIDIIAMDAESLVFAEVKVRRERGPVLAEATVDQRKLGRIMLAVESYLYEHEEYLDRVWRVDLIAITMNSVGTVRALHHYENLTFDE